MPDKIQWEQIYDRYINSENNLIAHIIPLVVGFCETETLGMFEEMKNEKQNIIICIQ
jgi:hypothetical protein